MKRLEKETKNIFKEKKRGKKKEEKIVLQREYNTRIEKQNLLSEKNTRKK